MNFWNKKRVLITGHTGFKGGWLVKTLKILGADIYGISLPDDSDQVFFKVGSVASALHQDNRINIIDKITLEQKIIEIDPEIVFHLAAQPIVGIGYQEPEATYATNIMGVVNVLNALRLSKNCRAIVNVTTDKVYDNRDWPWPYRETDALGGKDPYSASKACAEIITQSYANSYFQECGVATARAGNVIGGGDFSKFRLVPDIIKSLAENRPVTIYNPNYIRPWQHVLDPIFGYIRLAELLFGDPKNFSGSYNFSGNTLNSKTVLDVVTIFQERYPDLVVQTPLESRSFREEGTLILDSSKAQAQLSWRGRLDFRTAIEDTIDWYQEYINKHDVALKTDHQILRYLEGLG